MWISCLVEENFSNFRELEIMWWNVLFCVLGLVVKGVGEFCGYEKDIG